MKLNQIIATAVMAVLGVAVVVTVLMGLDGARRGNGANHKSTDLSQVVSDVYSKEIVTIITDLYAVCYLDDSATGAEPQIAKRGQTPAEAAAALAEKFGATSAGARDLTEYAEELAAAREAMARAPDPLSVAGVSAEVQSLETTTNAAAGEDVLDVELYVTTEYHGGGPLTEELLVLRVTVGADSGEIKAFERPDPHQSSR
ncbi:MAG: hypothetical protein LBJ02_07225 [Bifidobacteriaceae bacterium]|jgi:hypothetical protein|nr:hypothetical protein [Bifidobacteriaceae bacterium]